jgi:hypothetical protein
MIGRTLKNLEKHSISLLFTPVGLLNDLIIFNRYRHHWLFLPKCRVSCAGGT